MKRPVFPYHLVDVSPWPFLMSIGVFTFAISFASWLTQAVPAEGTITSFAAVIPAIIQIAFLWFRDIVREAKGGFHTVTVQRGIYIGFLLFQLSEIMLFFSFIWAYLHASLAPAAELGSCWPPVGIEAINPWSLPLVGTTLLQTSGMTVTLSHHALIKGDKATTLLNQIFTIILGAGFIYLQATEYFLCSYTIADSVYGTVFFMLTGLHGLHVIAGVTFLLVNFFRIYNDTLTSSHHQSYGFSIAYWHLVDVVWLAVYLLAYIWGGEVL